MFIEITAKNDLTTKLAQEIVAIASKQTLTTYILSGNKKVNSKSIMGVISLGFKKDDVIYLEAIGEEAEEAIDELKNII